MSDDSPRQGRFVPAALVLALAALACGGKFDPGDQQTGGTAGSGAMSGAGGGTGASGGTSGSSGRGGGSGSGGVSGRGGAGGASGSGAVSGSGGTGGSPCTQGGVCASEGAICTEESCCPCQYKCTGGRWQGFACASCPAPHCPDLAPAHGTPCDACFTRTEGCMYNGCPAAPRVLARCEGDRWTVQTEPCTGGCCAEDAQCGQGNVCASTVCRPMASNGCWRDADCGAMAFCSGALACPCNADCAYNDIMGQCVPSNASCCRSNQDCMTGSECVAGVCKLQPAAGMCWDDRRCFGGTKCKNAQVCPCGAACLLPDVLGQCG
jgi:hypothetical protein